MKWCIRKYCPFTWGSEGSGSGPEPASPQHQTVPASVKAADVRFLVKTSSSGPKIRRWREKPKSGSSVPTGGTPRTLQNRSDRPSPGLPSYQSHKNPKTKKKKKMGGRTKEKISVEPLFRHNIDFFLKMYKYSFPSGSTGGREGGEVPTGKQFLKNMPAN